MEIPDHLIPLTDTAGKVHAVDEWDVEEAVREAAADVFRNFFGHGGVSPAMGMHEFDIEGDPRLESAIKLDCREVEFESEGQSITADLREPVTKLIHKWCWAISARTDEAQVLIDQASEGGGDQLTAALKEESK